MRSFGDASAFASQTFKTIALAKGTRRLAMTYGNQEFKLRSVLKSAGDPEKPREGITGKLTGR